MQNVLQSSPGSMVAFALATTNRVALCGKTGSGKTFLVRALLSTVQRVVVADPKGTLTSWGLTDWNGNPKALKQDMYRLRIPAPLDGDWEPYCAAIYQQGDVLLYIDEMYGVVPPGKRLPPYLNALYTRGRELGIGVWAATQRPAWVPLVMLSEAEWIVTFRLQLESDRQRIAAIVGEKVLARVPDKYGFWLYNAEWDNPVYCKQLHVR